MAMNQAVFVLATTIALAVPEASVAQSPRVPGVTEVAPGVCMIDGTNVEVLALSGTELKAAIKQDPSFSRVKKLLGSEGITNPGPFPAPPDTWWQRQLSRE
jgi:hypothetical protein